MIFEFNSSTSQDEEWYENIHSDNSEPEMTTAIKIQDKISSLDLKLPVPLK